MKMNIKIFTALLLALNTMPGFSATSTTKGVTPGDKGCRNEAVALSDGKCSCENAATVHQKIWVLNQADYNKHDNYIAYNPNTGDCVEWIKISGISNGVAKCEHYGVKYGSGSNNTHPGQCFLIANENSRTPIRALIKTYNDNYNTLNNSPSRLIYNKKTNQGTIITLTNDNSLATRWVKGSTNGQSQPSVNAIISGYKTICRKNNYDNENEKVEYDFELLNAGDYTQYVCVEKSRITKKHQPKTSTGTGNSGNSDSGNKGNSNAGGDNVDNANEMRTIKINGVKEPQYYLAKHADTVEDFVAKYNAMYDAFNRDPYLLFNPDKVSYSGGYVSKATDSSISVKLGKLNLSNYYNQDMAFRVAVDGFENLCKTAPEKKVGIAKTVFQKPSYVKCILECSSNYTKDADNKHCTKKDTIVSDSDIETKENKTQIIQDHAKRIRSVATVNIGNTISYPLEYRNEKEIKTAENSWKEKCKKAVETAGGDTKNVIETKFDNNTNTLTCRVLKCKDANAKYDASQNICVVEQPKVQQTPKWEPDFAPARLGNSIVVPSDHVGDDVVKQWIAAANKAIADGDGTNEVTISDGPNGQKTIKCIITSCKNGKQPINNGTACPPDDKPTPEPTVNIEEETVATQQEEITEQEQKEKSSPTQADCDEDNKILDNGVCRQRTAEEACDYEGGTWTGTTCKCPEGEEWKVQYEQCVAKSAEQTSEEETNVTSATIGSDKQCPTHTAYDESTKTCKYKKQGPFPKSNCYVGSFYIYTNMSGQQKEDNENEFKEWQAACKNLAECKHATEMTWEQQNTGNDYINYGCIPKTCLPDFPDKKESGCEEETNVTDDVEVILNAFKQKAKQLKEQECAKQCETQNAG